MTLRQQIPVWRLWRRAACLLIVALVGWSPPATAQSADEEVDANGRWMGEVRFALAEHDDVTCKLAVLLKSYKFRTSFNCFAIWWLPPGRSWSISGSVKPDGTLQSTDIKWGYIRYAALAGGLRQARGPAGGQEFDMVAANPGPVEVIVTLQPELGAVAKAEVAEPEKTKSTATAAVSAKPVIEDGVYVGRTFCGDTSIYKDLKFRLVVTVRDSKVDINGISEGRNWATNLPTRSYDLKNKETVEFILSAGPIIVINFENHPPKVSAYIGGDRVPWCEWELEKQAKRE